MVGPRSLIRNAPRGFALQAMKRVLSYCPPSFKGGEVYGQVICPNGAG